MTSGAFAIRAALQERPTLVLLDISMPEMDGFEVCRRFKEDPSLESIPIVFLSALDGPGERTRAFEAGGADYITKPIDVAELCVRVETHISNARLRRRLDYVTGVLRRSLHPAALALEEEIERVTCAFDAPPVSADLKSLVERATRLAQRLEDLT